MTLNTSTQTIRLVAGFTALCVFVMTMVFASSYADAAVSTADHASTTHAATHHDCMNHGDENPDATAQAGGCHSGACCHAVSSSVTIASIAPQPQILQTFFQPMLSGIVLPTDIRPPIHAA